MMKHLMFAIVGLTLVSSPAFAAKHCVGKDGQEISVSGAGKKTRAKECRAAGGKWQKTKKHAAAK
jgi:hypothetical protein